MDQQEIHDLQLWANSSDADTWKHTDFPEKYDLIVLEAKTNAKLFRDLMACEPYSKKRIILKNVFEYGEKGSDGGVGVWNAIVAFLSTKSEWSVIHHGHKEFGITILSKQKSDRPKLPGIVEQVGNFTEAIVEHAKGGFGDVSVEEYEKRLELCTICECRNDKKCGLCGCLIRTKAQWKTSNCPQGKWNLPLERFYSS